MPEGSIDRVLPEPAAGASDDDLLEWYEAGAGPVWVRMNFVTSLDGSATHDGRSGGLGDAADRRVFALLRRLCDTVLVGAGTVRAEGYGGLVLDDASAAWRTAHGRAAQPVLAIVSARLDLDPASEVFADAPARPLVVTVEDAPAGRRRELERVADVVTAGAGRVEPGLLRAALIERGLARVGCEGGPTLAGAMLAAGVVDELCLTLAARLEGGDGPRLTGGVPAEASAMRLAQVLRSESTLLLRYLR